MVQCIWILHKFFSTWSSICSIQQLLLQWLMVAVCSFIKSRANHAARYGNVDINYGEVWSTYSLNFSPDQYGDGQEQDILIIVFPVMGDWKWPDVIFVPAEHTLHWRLQCTTWTDHGFGGWDGSLDPWTFFQQQNGESGDRESFPYISDGILPGLLMLQVGGEEGVL